MNYSEAYNVANTAIEYRKARVIRRDSDGNPCRIDYPAGTAEKAAKVAAEALTDEMAATLLCNFLEAKEILIVDGDRTS